NAQGWEWTYGFGAPSQRSAKGMAITTDEKGNSYVTGYFTDKMDFPPLTLQSDGTSDAFVAKYDINGKLVWIRQISGLDLEVGHGIALDGKNNIYVCGEFGGVANFGHEIFLKALVAGSDAFLAKYDNNGNIIWATLAGNAPPIGNFYNSATAYAVDVDLAGNSYITGWFNHAANFGNNITLTCNGALPDDYDMFVARYDTNGNVVWAQQGGGILADEGRGISVTSNGQCFVTGRFSTAQASFSGHILSCNNGNFDAFVASYNTLGVLLWATQSKDVAIPAVPNNCIANAIDNDSDGNSYITGFFYGTQHFGATTFTSTNSNADAFTIKIDTKGNIVWARQESGDNSEYGNAVSVDLNSKLVYVGGDYYSSIKFSNGNVATANQMNDLFFLGYDYSGKLQFEKQATTTAFGSTLGIAADPLDAKGNSFYVTGGYSTYSLEFLDQLNSPGGLTLNGLCDPGYDAGFVAKYMNPTLNTFNKTDVETVSVSPNPVSVELHIQDTVRRATPFVKMKITNSMSGIVLYSGEYRSALSTAGWDSGIYIITLESEDSVQHIRFIKE
ncbi:MAG TPA: SBBP repeat-containing protein, partial [Cyclobacteriaceae bacterium]|nr:SBBP repeat-containing protein [Cyclobacteriaceae bacterium]